MNQNSSFKSKSEKYNIAWFKLAEFVSRGEKERALGIYRLLTLSINDPALVLQLEGDILLAFNDTNAILQYEKAAKLYQQNGRIIEAISIYEHLISLNPQSSEFYNKLLQLYKILNFQDKVIFTTKRILLALLNENDIENSLIHLEELEKLTNENDLIEYYQETVFVLIKNKTAKEIIFGYTKKIVDKHFNDNDPNLQIFISKIEILEPNLYADIIAYLELPKEKNENKNKN
ncbi:MAG: hypothetical protein P4L22_03985 [Candidatus Babeliales bacterium]|nr:hypothetical protein [Candidatus Babeliales bacterium]